MIQRTRRFLAVLLVSLLFFVPVSVYASDGPETPEAFEEPWIVDPWRLYPYEQMTEDLAALEARYPELISVSSIGQSVEGREIPVFRLGRGERVVLVCAAMHAREYETTNFVMYMAELYCRGYESDAWFSGLSYRRLLDGVTFVVVPQLNPDGVVIAQNSAEYLAEHPELAELPVTEGWPPNDYSWWKANSRGVDLNRNWPYNWNNWVKCREPSSADYAGPEPLSESETQAMMRLIETTPFEAFCSFHSAGNSIYWIDSSNSEALWSKLYPVAKRIADFIGYALLPVEDISRFGGYMINYSRATYEKPCITVELGPFVARYPFSDYDGLRAVAERAFPICLLLADEVLKAAPEPEESPDALPAGESVPEGGDAPAEIEAGPTESEAAPPEDEAPTREITVTLDGAAVEFPDARPIIENDRVLTPMRAVCEAAGLTVTWDAGTITVTNDAHTVVMRVDSDRLDADGEAVLLDCPPRLIRDRTLLPLRALMEVFGYRVDWDDASSTVLITSADAETPSLPDGD